MEQNCTDNLPKLVPLWYSQPSKYMCSNNNSDKLPDYGGIGFDINLEKNWMRKISTHAIDRVYFKAEVCSLPFMPANKVPMGKDPCLNALNISREDFKKFCFKLRTLRKTIKSNYYEDYKNEILSAHKKVKQMCRTGEYTKISLPENIVELAHIFPETTEIPKVNLNYSGGCLVSTKKTNGSPVLLHPTGKKLDRLTFTVLEHSQEPYRTFQPSMDSEENIIKLGSDYIMQIKCAFDGYCYVRDNKHIHFVDFSDYLNISSSECLMGKNIINIEASHYCPTELICILENACNFGSHPKSILSITDKKLFSFDIRTKAETPLEMFSCYHSSCAKDENFTSMKRLVTNPFQHFVSSSHHMFLFDERYRGKPVHRWNHLLNGLPLYCDISTYNTQSDSSDVVVLLGTQTTQELVSFVVNSRNSLVQSTTSLTPPLFLSSPSDCANSLKFHCQNVDEDIIERLSCPLVGISAISHDNQSAFTAFQLTSPGDLFYQDFKADSGISCERTFRVDAGCILTPAEKILPCLKDWTVNCKKSKRQKNVLNDANRVNVDLKKILNKRNNVSSTCALCTFYGLSNNREFISDDLCSTCGLENLQSENLIKASTEMNLYAGPTSEECDISQFDTSSFYQFTDSYSKKILKAWSSIEDAENGNSASEPYELEELRPSPFVSTKSYFNTPFMKLDSFHTPFSENNISELQSQRAISFVDETLNSIPLSQQSVEDFIPPSQDIRPVIGETLRTPKTKKLYRKSTPSAGFC
ncbi:uncharacterized protein CDAR_186311 [Caerostris darwini]|uniref:TAF1C helical bundle domain-containing protein n=1 Tax=Caerostris darwini TaxID=1538125 RepID=A0AAV4WES9_9ARAC|nr:uncharacterized protein CDAR_186311 [Caerostris darwini]